LVVRLRPPHGARNPGGFDYEQWLLLSGHGATGYVRSGALAATGERSFPRAWLKLRAKIASRIGSAAADADAAALLTALSIGERFRFTEQHWTDFRRTGTSHLVAVSGMHVGLLGLLVFGALRVLWIRLPPPLGAYDLEVAATGSVLSTAYYAALTGFAVPAQRSLVMIAVALALLVSRRSVGLLQGLAATLLAVLVWEPLAPLSVSFWLSFVAVGIVLVLAAPRRCAAVAEGRMQRILRSVHLVGALQWSIGLALLPLTAFFFGELSLFGPLVNLVAIPLFNLVLVPLTLLATIAASIDALATTVAPALVHAVGWLASYTVAWLHSVAGLRGAAFAVAQAQWPVLVLAVLGVAFALPAHALPGRRLGWFAVLPMLHPPLHGPEAGSVQAVVLDVGHGLAVLVETQAHRLLFDAGPSFRSGFDSGAEIVLPALAASGRRDLDLLIVSHADNDHAGGAGAVAAAFPGVEVLKGPDVTGLAGKVCVRGQRWEWDGVQFAILHPAAEFAWRGNDSSCVLKVTAAGGSLLIAGDIERRGEAAVVALPGSAADVVIVPHHGSATSSSAQFVRAVGAQHAVVSAGFANRWGFPRPEVRARWEQSGAAVVVTGDAGAVTVTIGSEGPVVRAERERRHRYWQSGATDASRPTFPW
jgi:competence protein ComEC